MTDKNEIRQYFLSKLTLEESERELNSIVDYYLETKGIDQENIDTDIESLNKGIPVQYVCNKSFFYGFEFYVDESVLIPRPETEELVYWIIEENKNKASLRIIDIGTGSGCIIISLLNKLNLEKGIALDVSLPALQIAGRNANMYGKALELIQWDILDGAPKIDLSEIDIIVCNPPYILKSEKIRMDVSVLDYEPEEALFVEGEDALVFYKSLIDQFKVCKTQNSLLYFETSDWYKAELEKYIFDKGLQYEFRKDLQNNWRMLKVWKD